MRNGDIKHLCDDKCFKIFRASPTAYLKGKNDATSNGELSTTSSTSAVCGLCKTTIPAGKVGQFNLSVGKESKMFCNTECRAEFKKKHKGCLHCNADVTNVSTSIVAPVENGKFMDFCSTVCHSKYEKSQEKVDNNDEDLEIVGTSTTTPTGTNKPSQGVTTRNAPTLSKCSVCHKNCTVKHEVSFKNVHHKLCSDPCFAAFRYANKLSMTTCDNCKKVCQSENNTNTIQFNGQTKRFCNQLCINSFKNKNEKITPCTWCQTKKSNFDMVERIDSNGKSQLFCSLNCLSLYRVNLQATSNQHVTCDQCSKFAPAQYHLTMSDASVRNFCAYNCVMAFQSKFQQPQTSGRGQSQQSGGASGTTNSAKGRGRGGSRTSARGLWSFLFYYVWKI